MAQEFFQKQKEALDLLHSDATNIMLYGGRRSGKTYAICSDLVAVAYQAPGARILIGRSHLNHIRASLWSQTIPDVLKHYPSSSYKLNHSDMTFKIPRNGSEIVLCGFDDKARIDKHLGSEYAIIYCNECSTISYGAVLLAQSSLAQPLEGIANKMIMDMNPPSPRHWSYSLFEKKEEPRSGKPLPNPEAYVSMKLNPMDNPYLPADFIKRLDTLPERERRRYRDGEYIKPEGAVYDKFDLAKSAIDIKDLPQIEYFTVGLDFGLNCASVLIGFAGENIYILDEFTAYNMTASDHNSQIYYKWGQYSPVVYCDPSGGERLGEIFNSTKADNAVEAGINYVCQKIENDQFFIVTKEGRPNCPQLLAEMDSYRYDEKGRIVKIDDHLVDSTRYGIYSHAKYGGSILREAS